MRFQHSLMFTTALISGLAAAAAHASFKPVVTPLSVYPGCEAPKAVTGAKTYYVDPVNGLDTNDGSESKPWKTLDEVVNKRVASARFIAPYGSNQGKTRAVNAQGEVKPGDTILLMNGSHGTLNLTGVNSDFITIKAAPGHTPHLNAISARGANKWIFQGLKVQGNTGPMVQFTGHSWMGPNGNIIFDGNSVSTVDDASNWTPEDFRFKGKTGVYSGVPTGGNLNDVNSHCIAITNNVIKNITGGAVLQGNRALFAGNTVDMFGNGDGLVFAASDLLISQNLITNAVKRVTDVHMDMIQGRIGNGKDYKNIVIDRNTLIRQTNPKIIAEPGVQGLGVFDSDWYNVSVTNNVIVVATWHGLSWYGMHGGLIANNTVINDGLTANRSTRILLTKSKPAYSNSDNVIIRNNIATTITADLTLDNITVDHNAAGGFNLVKRVDDKVRHVKFNTPGAHENNNRVIADLNTHFVNYDPATTTYDLSLKADSPLVNSGYSAQVPSYDLTSRARITPYDVGALEMLPKTPDVSLTPTLENAKVSGEILIKANARQLGAPTLTVLVDGKAIGTARVEADSGKGGVGTYRIPFASAETPKQVRVEVSGFRHSGKSWDSVSVFNAMYDPAGPVRVDMVRTPAVGKATSGSVDLTPTSTRYRTDGAVTFTLAATK